jgi:hypothetical protein
MPRETMSPRERWLAVLTRRTPQPTSPALEAELDVMVAGSCAQSL